MFIQDVEQKIEEKLQQAKADILHAAQVAILREFVSSGLARLATLDADRPERYSKALADIQ